MSRRTLPAPTPYESGIWGTAENPCPSARTLAAHLDGELDRARAQAVDEHLDRCTSCASDARRIENLSDCLRAWARTRGNVAPPSRLLGRVLREVNPEGAALRHETTSAHRRGWIAAAAAVLALAGGVVGGTRAPRLPVTTGRLPAVTVAFDDRGPALALPAVGAYPVAPALAAPRPLAALDRARALDLSIFDDEGATAVAERLDRAAGLRVDGGTYASLDRDAMPASIVPGFDRLRRWERWMADRERVARDPGTHDPSRAGVALSELWPDVAVDDFARAVEPASSAQGGVVLHAIRAPVGAAERDEPTPYDLATAVREGEAQPLVDAKADGTEFAVRVAAGTRPIFVPAGELIAGGACDRVVLDGAWIVPGREESVVRLATRPLAAPVARVASAPRVVGLVAGPALRAMLARGEDAAALEDLVRAQVRDAGLLGPVGSGELPLVALYGRSTAERAALEARAAALVAALGDGAVGFLATDPDGRFQGVERVDVPASIRASALARLLVGYLVEAHARSMFDGPRPGLRASDVTAALARRPLRLLPDPRSAPTTSGLAADARPAGVARGMEPVAGILLQGTLASGASERRVAWLSVLVPDYR